MAWFVDPLEEVIYRRTGRLSDPMHRLRASALQPGNTLAQNALRADEPYDPRMARGSRNVWDALVADIMHGSANAVARVPTVDVDTGRNIAVEDPRMFSDELRDTIIQNRQAAGLDERGRPLYSRYVGPTADEPGEAGFGTRGDSRGYWGDMARESGLTEDPEFMEYAARRAGVQLSPEEEQAGMSRARKMSAQQWGRVGPALTYEMLKRRGWRLGR